MFWQVCLICPTCNNETILRKCFYSSAGEFNFQTYCENCKQLIGWKTTSEALKYMASCADKKVENKQEENPVKKTTKQIPYLQERLSTEDIEFLKKWNIKP